MLLNFILSNILINYKTLEISNKNLSICCIVLYLILFIIDNVFFDEKFNPVNYVCVIDDKIYEYHTLTNEELFNKIYFIDDCYKKDLWYLNNATDALNISLFNKLILNHLKPLATFMSVLKISFNIKIIKRQYNLNIDIILYIIYLLTEIFYNIFCINVYAYYYLDENYNYNFMIKFNCILIITFIVLFFY
jgi:hypothetical protein